MTENSRHSKGESTESEITRRAFTQSVAGAAALAAVEPATAEEDVSNANAANVPPIEESFTPTEWDVIGPFQYQRRGVETGWLFPNGGESAYATGERTLDDGQRFQSAFAGGATVTWEQVGLADGESSVPLDFGDRIDPTGGDLTPLTGEPGSFDDFQDWFGAGGVLYSVGYAVAAFDVPETRRAVLETDASVAWLNGARYEEPPQGVVLESGTNYLLLKNTVTFGSGFVSVSFRSPRAPVEVNELASFRGTPQNVILPDLREGKSTDRPAAVRVTNTTGEEQSPTLQFAPDSDLLEPQTVTVEPPLAPFETRRIETRVVTKERVPKQNASVATVEQETVPGLAMTSTETADVARSDRAQKTGGGEFTVEAASAETTTIVSVGEERDERAIPLRIRRTSEDRWQTTFVSEHDESVQTMGIKEPTNPDAGGPFELVVSLHGANVPAINQAGANVQRDGAYVVAPSARGPVNYDHEDLGRLDDLEAMAVMKDRFDIDETGIYLTGHSMGGHGTWHVGLTNPDRFAGLAPSAGWTDHETYLTVPFDHDKLHTFPRLKAVAESSLQKNLALPKTENAVDGTLPIFALHGGEDTSVPSLHPRTYLRALANRGLSVKGEVGEQYSTPDPTEVDVAYLEVPGQPHWWDAGIGEGNDSVNHPDLRTFLRSTTRNPHPAHVHLFTTNLRIEHRKYWVAVLEQETVHAPTRVDAEISSDGLRIDTENVAVLSIDPRAFREANVRVRGKPTATVNGESVKLPGGRKRIVVNLEDGPSASRGGRWRREHWRGGLRKTPNQYGPLKEIHHDPYRLVYGTRGSDAETAVNRNLANIRSQRLVERARAPATVIPDTAVDRSVMAEYNLVLFGRPSSNAVYRRLEDGFPIDVHDGHASIGGHDYAGDLGVEFIYPNPEHHDNLVQVETGTSLAGVQLTRVRNWIPTQKATPDYAVFDDSIRFQSWNACRAAGFFDKRWAVAPELGYLRSTSSVGVGREDGGGGEDDDRRGY